MTNREKVFDALRNCITEPKCKDCPWEDCERFGHKKAEVPVTLLLDALALLNWETAQWIWDRPHHFRCSGCNGVIGQRTYLYCPNCGREMLLSETERRKEWPEKVSGDA